MKSNLKLLTTAVAVAAGFASAPLLANELYGDIRLAINSEDAGAGDNQEQVNNASRVGLKGGYEIGDGVKAIYHVQIGLDADANGKEPMFTKRFAVAGLAGGFGTALFGTASSPYKMAGLGIDPFYDTSAGLTDGGANYGLSGFTNGFFDNVVAYITPDFSGLSGNAVVVMDDSTGNDHHFNWGLTYAQDGLKVGAQLLDVNAPGNEVEATRVVAGYTADMWSLGASMEKVSAATDTTYLYVAGTFNVTPETALKASYGDVEDEGNGFAVGVSHKLFKMTEIYALYSDVNRDSLSDRSALSIGISQKFSIGGK